jgi:putative colanic acid biosysnthesis UDP-glucose lipid carrier transferase
MERVAGAAVESASMAVNAPPLREIYPARGRARRRTPVGGALKRACDFVGALVLLALLWIPLVAIAIAIRLGSKGPALFRQRRGGYGGRPFLIFKFRTMTVEDDGKQVDQATPEDPRVTRLGAFLRKTSLDELPQLLNVLAGEMSLVGPRPHAVAHDRIFMEVDQTYRRRWRARPGITGLAQINGSRGPTTGPEDIRRRISFDVRYVEHWNIFLDAWILIRTALLLLFDRKAF